MHISAINLKDEDDELTIKHFPIFLIIMFAANTCKDKSYESRKKQNMLLLLENEEFNSIF